MVEVETVEDETPENLSIPTEASGNDVIPKNDAELEEEAFPPTESLGEFEITERNLPERGFESVEQSPTVVYKGEVEDHNSTTEKGVDIKGIATGFVGVIQGLSLLILT